MRISREAIRKVHDKNQWVTTILLARQWLRDHPEDAIVTRLCIEALYQIARYDEAISMIEEGLSRFNNEPVAQRVLASMRGHLHDLRGELSEAEAWYRKAILVQPDDASGYIYLGGTLAKRGQLKEAEGIHRQGIACKDGCIDEAFLNLGYVLRGQGRFEEAANCFRHAIKIDPGYVDAICALKDVEKAMQLTEEM